MRLLFASFVLLTAACAVHRPKVDMPEETPLAASARAEDFETYPLPEAATRLYATLGYRSDRTIPIASVAEFCREWDQDHILTPRERETLGQLTSLHFLFQLTDAELTLQRDLLDNGTGVDATPHDQTVLLLDAHVVAEVTGSSLSVNADAAGGIPWPVSATIISTTCITRISTITSTTTISRISTTV